MMKKIANCIFLFLCSLVAFSQQEDTTNIQAQLDSIEHSFTYQHGSITLKNGVGVINVPDGFKYLDAAQAEKVLVDLWGNAPGENISLGMILPEDQRLLSDTGYVFNIQYDEIGYVKDDDADKIDYQELLDQMKKDAVEENKERIKGGYEPVQIVGWASTPFYDKEKKILHWAKEVKFGDSEINTLNYNVRILGRKGVIVLNAIATMPNVAIVKKDVAKVLDIVQFSDGQAYKDFNPDMDEVAAWTIGGLVAGKLLAKAGVLAFLLKFWKLIAVAVAGAGGALWKKFRKKKEEEIIPEPVAAEQTPPETTV